MAPKPRIAYGAIGWLLQPMCKIALELKKLGLEGIEGFGLNDLLPEDDNLALDLKTAEITFVGAYFGASLVEPEKVEAELLDFEATVKQISRLGGGIVAVGGGRVLKRHPGGNWPCFIKAMGRMGRIAQKHNVRLAFHPHDGTIVFSSEEIGRFAADTDPAAIGFTFDTAHLGEAGLDICQELRKHAQRVCHIHLKDLKGSDFVELGRGALPLEEFLRELQLLRYAGWLTIELDSSLDPAGSAAISTKHLQKLLAQLDWR